jgi:hypothetical protein
MCVIFGLFKHNYVDLQQSYYIFRKTVAKPCSIEQLFVALTLNNRIYIMIPPFYIGL